MWYNNLMDIYEQWVKDTNGNKHILAEKSNLPYDTVKRVFSGKTENPTLDTLDRLAIAMGKDIGAIVAGTGTRVSTKTIEELQNQINDLLAERESIIEERDVAIENNNALKTEVTALTNEIMRMQLSHKDEIIELYKLLYSSKKDKEET